MNLKQAKIILEKINRLYQSMTLDEENIDVFEQDLMLSYTRQLYAAFSSEEKAGLKLPAEPPIPDHKTEPKAAPSRPEPPKDIPPKTAPEKILEPEPLPERTEVPTKSVRVEAPVVKPEVKAGSGNPAGEEEQEALFEQQEVKDLSGKLSQMPVKDLGKAMGLNERILTINELFGGDKRLFEDAVKTLNGFTTFEEAKIYLTKGIAAKYNWAEKSKSKKAKVFINLVRRRYK